MTFTNCGRTVCETACRPNARGQEVKGRSRLADARSAALEPLAAPSILRQQCVRQFCQQSRHGPCSSALGRVRLVPTIAEARVMIRRRDEDHSRRDDCRVDTRGTTGSGGAGWFANSRGPDARSSTDRAVGECGHGISCDRPPGRLHAGYGLEMAGPLCQRQDRGSERDR
jgi:hypothetical protein